MITSGSVGVPGHILSHEAVPGLLGILVLSRGQVVFSKRPKAGWGLVLFIFSTRSTSNPTEAYSQIG